MQQLLGGNSQFFQQPQPPSNPAEQHYEHTIQQLLAGNLQFFQKPQPPSNPAGQYYEHLIRQLLAGDPQVQQPHYPLPTPPQPGGAYFQPNFAQQPWAHLLQPQYSQGPPVPPSASPQSFSYPSLSTLVPPATQQPQPPANLDSVPPAPPSSNAIGGVSAASHLAGQLGGMHISGVGDPSAVNAPAPPTNSGAKLCKGWDAILDEELLMQVNTRPHSARATLGDTAVVEARKGLSRVLRPGDDADLELFAQQLKNTDAVACEPDFRGMKDKVVCFAISYVHSQEPVGRFKFTADQWDNFKAACREISDCGVKEMRVWLDQCLWLRDASQGAWAHTGLMPYVLWPVISLGVKAAGDERTLETFERMWPFVEEVAGLWSMGVIITRELRGSTAGATSRRWMSFQLRHRCEPEMSMRLILLNIFHGAVDDLHTGWTEDVDELKEMARWNFTCEGDEIIVGSDWKSRIAKLPRRQCYTLLSSLHLPYQMEYMEAINKYLNRSQGSINVYLDGSRKLPTEGRWNGIREWISGNDEADVGVDEFGMFMMQMNMTKVNLITDQGEFQILGHDGFGTAIWLLVAMDGRSSRFSRGHVAWTKVMHGESSCKIRQALLEQKKHVVESILHEQLGTRVRITSMTSQDSQPIQWT